MNTNRFATATADAIIGLHINRTLLIFYGMHGTDSKGVAILAIVSTNYVKHCCLLSTTAFRSVSFMISQAGDDTWIKCNKKETNLKFCRSLLDPTP